MDTPIVAAVWKVFPNGPHGAYAVAYARQADIAGDITFSLKNPCWKEKSFPESGTLVILSDVRRKTKGWRAQSARYVRVEDAALVDAAQQKGRRNERDKR